MKVSEPGGKCVCECVYCGANERHCGVVIEISMCRCWLRDGGVLVVEVVKAVLCGAMHGGYFESCFIVLGWYCGEVFSVISFLIVFVGSA